MFEIFTGFFIGLFFGAYIINKGVKDRIKADMIPYVSKKDTLEWEQKE